MSKANAAITTVGVTLTAAGAQILPRNLHRNSLLLATGGTDIQYAFGPAPKTTDYATLAAGRQIYFDDFVPVNELWLKGSGTAIVGTEDELPFDAPVTDPTLRFDWSKAIPVNEKNSSSYGGVTVAHSLQDGAHGGKANTLVGTYPAGTSGGWNYKIIPPADLTSISYKANARFNLQIVDDNKWVWWMLIPVSSAFRLLPITKAGFTLSGYQPDHPETDPKPSAPVYTTVPEVTLVLDATETAVKTLTVQYFNVKAK